jgi:hypothetical protein
MRDFQHLLTRRRVGPVDRRPPEDILALLPQLPSWPSLRRSRRAEALKGAATILDWLLTHNGDGWQDRWLAAGADTSKAWLADLAPQDTRAANTKRDEHQRGLAMLLLCRVVLPSYDFLISYQSQRLFDRVRQTWRPEVFARIEREAIERGLSNQQRAEALSALSKIVLHTARMSTS